MDKTKTVTISDLAQKYQCDRATIRKCLEAAGLEAVKLSGQSRLFDEELASKAIDAGMSSRVDIKALRIEKVKEEIRKLRIANDIRAREFIPVDEVRRSITRMCVNARSKLLAHERTMGQELRMKLALNDEQLAVFDEIAHRYHYDYLLSMSRAGEWYVGACPNCGVSFEKSVTAGEFRPADVSKFP